MQYFARAGRTNRRPPHGWVALLARVVALWLLVLQVAYAGDCAAVQPVQLSSGSSQVPGEDDGPKENCDDHDPLKCALTKPDEVEPLFAAEPQRIAIAARAARPDHLPYDTTRDARSIGAKEPLFLVTARVRV